MRIWHSGIRNSGVVLLESRGPLCSWCLAHTNNIEKKAGGALEEHSLFHSAEIVFDKKEKEKKHISLVARNWWAKSLSHACAAVDGLERSLKGSAHLKCSLIFLLVIVILQRTVTLINCIELVTFKAMSLHG